MPKPRKGSVANGKRRVAKGKLAEKTATAAKTVKEQKSLSHFCWDFFLRMWKLVWKLGRELFNFWPSDKMKEPSVSLEKPDVASSSPAVATPSGASVVAKRASEEQTEGPAEKMLSLGTANDKDHPCHARNSTGNRNEALPVGPEDIEAEFSSTRHMDGRSVHEGRLGYHRKEEAEVKMFGRVHETEGDANKSELAGSECGCKQRHDDQKKEIDDMKKENDNLKNRVKLRQAFSNYEKTQAFRDKMKTIEKEAQKPGTEMSKHFGMILLKASYTKILRTMFFQKRKMALKSNFKSSKWRKAHHFSKFSNDSFEYQWFEENYDPEILGKRLKILREAKPDLFMVIERVTDLNSTLHPQISEMSEVEIYSLARTIPSESSGGDWKI